MRLPFFKFDIQSWLTGNIRFLTPEEQGVFITLCALIWRDGGTYKINSFTHRQLNTSEQVLNKCLIVFNKADILLNNDGVLSVKFINEQIEETARIREKRSKAGKKSAEKRAGVQHMSTNKKEERRKKKEECRKKKEEIELPSWLDISTWNDFIEMRREKKKPATDNAIKLILKKLEKFGINNHVEILKKSIIHNWTDVYKIDNNNNQNQNDERTSQQVNDDFTRKKLEEFKKEQEMQNAMRQRMKEGLGI